MEKPFDLKVVEFQNNIYNLVNKALKEMPTTVVAMAFENINNVIQKDTEVKINQLKMQETKNKEKPETTTVPNDELKNTL